MTMTAQAKNGSLTEAPAGAGRLLAERLGLPIVGTEGHDLKVGCPFCPSSDGGRVHQEDGRFFCYVCGKKAGPWGLAQLVLGSPEAAVQVMKDVGSFKDRSSSNSRPRIVATYDYRDESGMLLHQVLRREPGADGKKKDFRIRRPEPGGGWTWKLKGARLVLYHLPHVIASPVVLILEGEKDCDRAASIGFVATTNAMGAGKWRREYNEHFRNKVVVIVPDNDQPGRDHAQDVARNLYGIAKSIKIVDLPGLPEKGDLSDWLDQGHTAAELVNAIDATPEWTPPTTTAAKPAATPAPVACSPVAPGTIVRATDRENFGEVLQDLGDSCVVHFKNPDTGAVADVTLSKAQLVTQDGKSLAPAAGPPRFISALLTSQQLDDLDSEPKYLVKNAVPAGQLGAAGAKQKGCKTSVVVDLVISSASATPFLDEFDVPEPVPCLFLCGESGSSRIRRQARQVCEKRGIALATLPIWWGFDLPKLCLPEHVEALGNFIVENKIGLVPIDPLYLSLFTKETAGRSGDLFTMGSVYEPLTKVCRETGAAILLVHHFRKNRSDDQQEPCSLEELTQAGLGECARWWMLLDRREPYAGDGKHALWFRVGGSEGHASFWSLDIDEGLIVDSEGNQRTTKWEATLSHVQDVKAEEKRQRENRKAADIERREAGHVESLVQALRKYPGGQTGRQLRVDARLNSDNFLRAVAVMKQTGRIEEILVPTKRGNYDGYRLIK